MMASRILPIMIWLAAAEGRVQISCDYDGIATDIQGAQSEGRTRCSSPAALRRPRPAPIRPAPTRPCWRHGCAAAAVSALVMPFLAHPASNIIALSSQSGTIHAQPYCAAARHDLCCTA